MKLTYIPDGSDDCPLIEIDTESSEEILKLVDVWESLASKNETRLCLNEIMETDNSCVLDCIVGVKSNGVRKIDDQKFSCELTPRKLGTD